MVWMLATLQVFVAQPIAHAILVLTTVAVAGLALGSIKYHGIALGSAGVLFAGIIFGHFGERIDHAILDFAKEFGLVLFVFTIGLQLGPGFVAALRQQGLKLNVLALAVVIGGAAMAALGAKLLQIDSAASLGIFSGATSNTPSLGAAQQALATMPGIPADRAELPALAYAVSYPIGTAGIIGSLLVLRAAYRIDSVKEAEAFRAEQQRGIEPLERMNLLVENRSLEGLPLRQLAVLRETGVTISRVRGAGSAEAQRAAADTQLHVGDVLLAVGTPSRLKQLAPILGRATDEDLMKSPGNLTTRRIVVTRKAVLGRTIAELGWGHLHGVTVTRVGRGDLEMSAVPNLRLRFGDVIQVVGESDALDEASIEAGNSVKAMNETQFIPLFLGMGLGVVAGLVPISFPGLPVSVRLGLAGGPLILGIVLSRLGHVGNLVWHVPHNANIAFRELGITLFLAAVGLIAGQKFFHSAFSRAGVLWVICAFATAMLPLLVVGAVARSLLKMNYTTISGLIAGSTTDPPALAFAGLLAKSDGPSVAYATVYPLTMLLRILAAQCLAILLCR
jgi:putative transport protein